MKNIRHIQFKKYQVINLSGRYFINLSNGNDNIVLNGIKYYNIKKSDLILMGMKFPKLVVNPLSPEELEELKKSIREYIQLHQTSIGNTMVDMGYKISGFNC